MRHDHERAAINIMCSVLVLFLFAVCMPAQTLLGPHDLTILESKWRIEVRNRALEQDPFAANKEREREERQQKAVAQQNEGRLRQGEPTLPPQTAQPTLITGPRGISATYVYEVKVKNNGPKEIRAISWEYVFLDPGTMREEGRRPFISKVRIRSGGTKNVFGRSRSSPTGTIDATKVGKKPADQYSTQIVIRKIEYVDGSVWPAPAK